MTQEEIIEMRKQEPVAYINIEERKLEWAYKYMSWDTPTVINLPKIPLYTTPPQPKEPEQEPVAWAMLHDNGHFIDAIHPDEHARVQGEYTHPLYTTPPQRTWVGLTDEEIAEFAERMEASDPTDSFWREFSRAIEAKLKDKNERISP